MTTVAIPAREKRSRIGARPSRPAPTPLTPAKKAQELKQALALILRKYIEQRKLNISDIARQTGTGREAIRRVLDSHNTAITLTTMVRTADALGLSLELRAIEDDVTTSLRVNNSRLGAMLDAEEN